MSVKNIGQIRGLETLHVALVLEQLVRGYLCGSNTKKRGEHVFSYNSTKGKSNINSYFYCFKFQQCGTVYLHLLVWLKNVLYTKHNLFRADIPWECPELAYLVSSLQPFDRGCMTLNNSPSEVFTR